MSEQPQTTLPEEEQSPDPIRRGLDFCSDTMEGIATSASIDAVYGQPVQTEFGQVIIPAAEILNYSGYFLGTGSGPTKAVKGLGSAGGGRVLSRPVAVIVADRNGVEVRPVLDTSKILLTILSTLGFITASWLGMGRARKFRKPPEVGQG